VLKQQKHLVNRKKLIIFDVGRNSTTGVEWLIVVKGHEKRE